MTIELTCKVSCDHPGCTSTLSRTGQKNAGEAWQAARDEGWIHSMGGQDLCPEHHR